VEDDSPIATDHWVFSCEIDGKSFAIFTASSTSRRDEGIPASGSSPVPYKTGEFFLVYPLPNLGETARPDSLGPFPGTLTNP